MRRTITYVGAWVAAGATAVVLASVGVSMVGHQVTAPHPSPLSADEVRAELTGPGAPTSTTSAVPDPAAATPPSSPTDVAPTPAGASPITTQPAPPVGASDDGDDGTPPATQSAAETRSYSLVGGSVTLSFASTGVKVVVAAPNPGYAVEVTATHENGVRVELRSDEHRSQVEGWWDGGPQDEVREED